MTAGERNLAAVLLEMASEAFSRQVCSDFDPTKYLSPGEIAELVRVFPKMNRSRPEPEEDRLALGNDWILMDLMAYRLRREHDAVEAAIRDARESERAAIAGWLRRCGNPGTAAAILRGEHER